MIESSNEVYIFKIIVEDFKAMNVADSCTGLPCAPHLPWSVSHCPPLLL